MVELLLQLERYIVVIQTMVETRCAFASVIHLKHFTSVAHLYQTQTWSSLGALKKHIKQAHGMECASSTQGSLSSFEDQRVARELVLKHTGNVSALLTD